MNIVYLLTNIDKTSFPNKYIGSKTECQIVDFEGLPTIICNKSNTFYLGSSKNPEMLTDLASGHRFVAEVLEEVWDRKYLVKKENSYMENVQAVESDEYYNLGSALLDGFTKLDAPANFFGETIRQRASRESARSKRDTVATSAGFKNFGEMCFHIHSEILKGVQVSNISESLGKQRKFATRTIQEYDMEKATKELPEAEYHKEQIRKDYLKQATLEKLKEIYGYEIPTLRLVIGDFKKDRAYTVASEKGMTKEELELFITKEILDGKGFLEVSRETGIVLESVKRYFFRCIRSRVKSSDLN